MNRIELLRAFIKEDPTDPFYSYALGLELMKSDMPAAIEQFLEVLARFPQYLPTYYIASKALSGSGRSAEALEIVGKGIVLADTTHDLKALAELRALKQELED